MEKIPLFSVLSRAEHELQAEHLLCFGSECCPSWERPALNLSLVPSLGSWTGIAACWNLTVSCEVAPGIKVRSVLKFLPASGLAEAPGSLVARSWYSL